MTTDHQLSDSAVPRHRKIGCAEQNRTDVSRLWASRATVTPPRNKKFDQDFTNTFMHKSICSKESIYHEESNP